MLYKLSINRYGTLTYLDFNVPLSSFLLGQIKAWNTSIQQSLGPQASFMWSFFCPVTRECDHSGGGSLTSLSPPLKRISLVNFVHFILKPLKNNKKDLN